MFEVGDRVVCIKAPGAHCYRAKVGDVLVVESVSPDRDPFVKPINFLATHPLFGPGWYDIGHFKLAQERTLNRKLVSNRGNISVFSARYGS